MTNIGNSGSQQQAELEVQAGRLLGLLEAYVPSNVAHYAVEDLRHALTQYLRPGVPAVLTKDVSQREREAFVAAAAAENVRRTQATVDAELAEMKAAEDHVMDLVVAHGIVYSNHMGSDTTLAIKRLAARGTLVKAEGSDRGYRLPENDHLS